MKHILLLILFILCVQGAYAQSTTVSGQVTDAGGQSWNNGKLIFSFVPAPNQNLNPSTWTGGAFNSAASITTALNATGGYSISIPSNTAISPSGSSWTIAACPQATSSCFYATQVITGGTQTINLTPPAISIVPGVGVLAYSTSEISGASIGSQFYLLGVTGGLQVCTAVSGSNCATWVSGGGGGVAPITTAWYASPNCSGSNCSFVNANTHWVCDATTTNTSNIVSAPDGNFLVTAKVGQTVWAMSANCNAADGTLAIVETTICSLDSATQIHVGTVVSGTCGTPTNATASVVGTSMLIWGTLDTPTAGNCATGTDNVKTAWNAAIAAGVTLYLPSGGGSITGGGSGGIMMECSEFQAPSSTTAANPVNLIGHVNSYVFGTPNFDFTSVPAGNAGAMATIQPGANALPNISVLRDITFLCGGVHNWGTGVSSHPIILAGRVVLTNVTGWGCGSGGITNGIQVGGPSTVIGAFFYNFGQTACNSQNVGQNQTVVFTGNGYCAGPTAMQMNGSGNWTTSYGTFFQSFSGGLGSVVLGATNQVFNSFGDLLQSDNNGVNGIAMRNTSSGSKANLFGTWVYTGSEQSNFGLIYTGAGAITNLHGTTVQGTGTGAIIGGTGLTAIYNDMGGNNLTGGTICASSACTYLNEANSSNQVLVTAAKTVLSAGWGTTAGVTALSGGNAPIQFTITNSGTGQGASPTITYTFPTAYLVAPFSCTATQVGGTNATGTFTSSALSATGVTFTFSLTPTASSTEIVQVVCVTP